VARSQRNILDDITDGVRQLLDEIDRLINPDKQRKPVPVPVPVRVRPQRRDPDSYR
jgi:hypothetical protein